MRVAVAAGMVVVMFRGEVAVVGDGRGGGVDDVVKSGALDSVVMMLIEERLVEVEGGTGLEGRDEELDGTLGVEVVVLLLRLLMLHPGGRVHDLVVTVAEGLVAVTVPFCVVGWLTELAGSGENDQQQM